MPGSIVEQYSAGLLPAGTFAVELTYQVAEERSHDVRIGVCLGEAEPDPSLSVERSDQGEARRNLLVGERARCIGRGPDP